MPNRRVVEDCVRVDDNSRYSLIIMFGCGRQRG